MNHKEILQALIDGKELRYVFSDEIDITVKLMTDRLMFDGYHGRSWIYKDCLYWLFNNSTRWQIAEPPKRYAKTMDEVLKAKGVLVTLPGLSSQLIVNPVDGKIYWSMEWLILREALATPGATVEVVED